MNYLVLVSFILLGTSHSEKITKNLIFQLPTTDPNHVTGHLKVDISDLSEHNNDNYDVTKTMYVCLGGLKTGKVGAVLEDWKINSCGFKNENAISVFVLKDRLISMSNNQPSNYIEIPFEFNKASTHLLVIKNTLVNDVTSPVVYSSPLPPIFSNTNEKQEIILISNEDFIKCHLSIECISNFYGPRCATFCNPPSNRHLCDHVTGELGCQSEWQGNDCQSKVFIGMEEASQFIKSRQKRANSFFRFEEISAGNIERECEEETCSREEAREAFEDDTLTEQYWARYTDPNQCIPTPCFPGRALRCEDRLADYTCHCKPGYQGKNCQLAIDVCANAPCINGLCTKHSPTSFACVCESGFIGSLCQTNIDDCVEANCGTHGTCVDGINDYSCSCDLGYTGNVCEVDINECENSPCQNGGNCSDHIGFYECFCATDYNGRNCENRIDPCTKTPCQNNGICSSLADFSFVCHCSPLFTGKQCEHRSDGPCGSAPCQNRGTCIVTMSSLITREAGAGNITTNATQGFECLCDIGFGGTTCETEIPACEYAGQPCPNNSTCVSLDRQYFCLCPTGFTGEFCNEPGNNTLEEFRCATNMCMNKARCLSHNNKTTCVCRDGYNGTHCENEINYCASSPCINDGICIPIPGDFICECTPGFNGKYCETDVDECTEIQCRNNGVCNNTIGSFECICNSYHTGRFCEQDFDPCTSDPCNNGASCVHGADNYECVCLIGYGGVHCSFVINPCTDITSPCKNQANCSIDVNDTTQAVCHCLPGYHGRYCETENDYCVVLSTENRLDEVTGEEIPLLIPRTDCGINGDCVNSKTNFFCKCHPGFEGLRCENVFNPPIVNCSSEFCECPQKTFELIEEHNLTDLHCEHNYDTGLCKIPKCLSSSCTDNSMYCEWKSRCIMSQNEGSPDCPIMKLHLNQTKLPQNVSVQSYCNFLRNMSSYKRFENSVAIHCFNDHNLTLAVSFDGITSEVNAFLLGAEMFQLLEEEVLTSSQKLREEPMSPLISAIIGLEFNSQRGHALKPPERRGSGAPAEEKNSILFIVIPVAFVVLFIFIVVFFVVRRRKKENLVLTYVGNNTDIITSGETGSVDRVIVSPTRAKWSKSPPRSNKKKIKESFVNPLFIEEPICKGLTSKNTNGLAPRPSVISNQYVSPKFERQSKLIEPTENGVEQSTIAFKIDQPAGMKVETEYSMASTLPHHMVTIPPPKSSPKRSRAPSTENPYSFAMDGSPRPSNRRNRNSNPYEEITLSPARASQKAESTDKNLEIPDPFAEMARKRSPSKAHTYELGDADSLYDSDGDVNPFKSDSSGSEAPSDGIDAIPPVVDTCTSTPASPAKSLPDSSGSEPAEEHYKSPKSYFPAHDELFFPEKSEELPGIYQVPPKTYPPE